MKILWLSHFVPWPLRGGAQQRSFHLSRQAARGHEVVFLGLVQKPLYRSERDLDEARRALAGHCARVHLFPRASERGPWVKQRVVLRSLIGGSYDEVWLRSRALRHALERELSVLRPDVIHVDTVGLAPYAEVCGGRPAVLNHHNVESQMMLRRSTQAGGVAERWVLGLQARRLRELERRSESRFHAHLTVSELDAERLQQVVPLARTTVVPNGVDLEYFAAADGDEARPGSMVWVGGMNWYPNRKAVEWFLDHALPPVLSERPEATFTVIGRHPSPQLLRAAEADSRIRVLGEVPDIRPHVRRSQVYVCPIHDGGGTRLKILDAMSQGIPIVSTQMAVEGIEIASGVHASLADDGPGFARAVVRLFDHPDQRRSLALAARKLVEERYSWDSIGARLRDAYAAVLEEQRGHRRASAV